uniref:SWIB domain-containing protein n=1 Tax=Caenorhabditis tropicalis TaxID=1561998 RepID=A0A1I7TIM0_9PELO
MGKRKVKPLATMAPRRSIPPPSPHTQPGGYYYMIFQRRAELRAARAENRAPPVQIRTSIVQYRAESAQNRAKLAETRAESAQRRAERARNRAAVVENRSGPVQSPPASTPRRSVRVQTRAAAVQSPAGPVQSRATPVQRRAAPVQRRAAPVQPVPVRQLAVMRRLKSLRLDNTRTFLNNYLPEYHFDVDGIYKECDVQQLPAGMKNPVFKYFQREHYGFDATKIAIMAKFAAYILRSDGAVAYILITPLSFFFHVMDFNVFTISKAGGGVNF